MKQWTLRGSFLELQDGADVRSASADEIYSAIIEGNPAWSDIAPGKSGDAAGIEFSPYPASLRAVLSDSPEGGLPQITLEIETQTGERFPVPHEILDRGHVVANHVWYPVMPADMEEMRALLAGGGSAPDHRPSTLRDLLDLKSESSRGGPVDDRTSSGHEATIRLGTRSDDRPEGVSATLYPYQIDGWQWLRFIVREQLGGLLADEMGLGKTLQVISALRDPGGGKAISQALVVAPGSLLENWSREIRKFAPDLSVLKHHGSLRTGRPADLMTYDVVIVSYDTVIRDLSLLKMIEWSVVILDEAQNIKNPEALRTKMVKQLPRKVGLAMTGTPVENRLTDLWSIMDFAVPGYLGTIDDFHQAYDNDVEAASRLEPLVSPLMLRRRVAEVAQDLPERIDIPEVIELTEQEAAEYDRIREEIFEEYGKAASLVSLTSLRLFCAHPAILGRTSADFDTGSFSKFERLRELLAEIAGNGDKAIVFTSYTDMADRIFSLVTNELGIFSATLDGRLPIDDRQPLIDRFSATQGPAVLVLNPKAGGSGLNITAANHVIHYNLEWNPALEDQASARAYRRGQERPVTVRRLFCAGTVEEIVDERVERKRLLSSAAVIGVEGQDQDYEDVVAALERSPVRRR